MTSPSVRRVCPSCRFRLSPLALECPVCGLPLERRPLPRPLLFQASAVGILAEEAPRTQALAAPALGRVAPVAITVGADEEVEAPEPFFGLQEEPVYVEQPPSDEAPSFWPLAKMEVLEALVMGGVNLFVLAVACLLSGVWPARLYGELWPMMLLLHVTISWAYMMVPLTLAGQSLTMGLMGMLVDTGTPERRLAFSLFHLLSVSLFPLSFLTMVLTRNHRTLAELLTGQEILIRAK